jgi:WD40 repeat protein/tetratricopeptide (TPR) repeat protein
MSGSGWELAIDFGTANTAAAIAVDGRPPTLLEVENGRYLPSAVFAADGGALLTGRAAVRQGVSFPERLERTPKRALARQTHVLLAGAEREVIDLAAAVIGRMYAEAVRVQGGEPPDRVVLTHPVRWGETQRQRLVAAAARAQIREPTLVPEPVAAAWFYARPSAGQLFAVFDLGGGTLDTAVLRASDTGLELAGAPGGDADLGGEDFDELLFDRVSELARDRDEAEWKDAFAAEGPRARRDLAYLRADVTAAKEALSEQRTYDLPVMGFAEAFRLTRPELESLLAPAIDTATAELRRTLLAAGTTPDDLTGLFLSGGSSRVPAIAARLSASLGVQPRLSDDPKGVVALGALSVGTVAFDSAAAKLSKADRLLAEYRFAEAVVAYEAVLAQEPSHVEALIGLSTAWSRQAFHARAERAARKAATLRPEDAKVQLALARGLAGQQKQAQEAEAACRKALLLDPGQIATYVTLGNALSQLKQHDQAREAFQRAIDSGDRSAAEGARVGLGVMLMGIGDRAGARAALQPVSDGLDPHRAPLADYYLAAICAQEGDSPGYSHFYQKAVDSQHPVARPGALLLAGTLLKKRPEKKSSARALLRLVVNSGHPLFLAKAQAALSILDAPAREVRKVTGTGPLTRVAFSPKGTYLAAVGSEGAVRLWETETGKQIRSSRVRLPKNELLWGIAFSPNGKLYATVGGENVARLWNVSDGRANGVMAGHTDKVRTVAFAPQGLMLATGSNDKTARVWDPAAGTCVLRLAGHTNLVHALAYRPDGRMLATAGDQTVRLWELPSGRCVQVLAGHTDWMWDVAFSPDGALVASGGKDQTVRLWKTDTGAHVRTLTGHTGGVTGLAFSPDGLLVASSSNDKTVRVWEVASGDVAHVLTGHRGQVQMVAWHPGGGTLASCGDDHTVRLWGAEETKPAVSSKPAVSPKSTVSPKRTAPPK